MSRPYERAYDLLYARAYNVIAHCSPARLPRKALARAHDLITYRPPARPARKPNARAHGVFARRPVARMPRKANAHAHGVFARRPAARLPRKILAGVLLVCVALAAVATWLKVARTVRDADPVPPAKLPRVTGVVWSNRVFVDEATFRKWLAAHGVSYTVWARNHPGAVAMLVRKAHRR